MSIVKKIFLLLCLTTFIVSCSKDTIFVDVSCNHNSGTNNNNNPSDSGSYNIRFLADIDPVKRKSGTTLLQQNRYVTIYTYAQLNDFVNSISYKTSQAGFLTPIDGSEQKLVPGSYDFYAVGIANMPLPPPIFSDVESGIYRELNNGIDYIKASIRSQTINTNTILPLTMNHVCSQIIVNVASADASIKVDSLANATIEQPDASQVIMSLFTGTISSSSSLATEPISMNINDMSCHQILLPLKHSGALKMNFGAYINGSTTPNNYSVEIPIINANLSSGSSYVYSILVDRNQVVFNTVRINDWTEVDETGKPITATPVP